MGSNGSKQLVVKCTVRGTKPMLQDAMPAEEIWEVLVQRQRKPAKTDMTREEMAELGLYRGPNGELGVPLENFFASLRGAGRLVKFDGKRSISTAESTLLPSFLEIEEEFFPFENGAAWVPDLRRGQLKDKSKTACGIVRPRFKEWSFTATLMIDTARTTEETVRRLVEEAGKSQGIGSFRPSCNGVFGKFEIANWEVVSKT